MSGIGMIGGKGGISKIPNQESIVSKYASEKETVQAYGRELIGEIREKGRRLKNQLYVVYQR